jgi:S1-C subfamily serine protease
LVISQVTGDSWARRAGLRTGDQIISVNGNRIDSQRNFNRYLVGRSGQRIPIVIWRDGQQQTVYWTGSNQYNQGRETFAQDRWEDRQYDDDEDDYQQQSGAFLGVDFDTRYRDAVVVRRVHPNSPAQRFGVRAGDTILSINGETVTSGEDVSEMVSEMSPGDEIDLQVIHAQPRTLQVRLSTRQAQQTHQSYAGYRGENINQENWSDDSDYDNDNDNDYDNEDGVIDRVFNRGGLFGRD